MAEETEGESGGVGGGEKTFGEKVKGSGRGGT